MAGIVKSRWILEAPTDPLSESAKYAEINQNAITLLPGAEDDAALTYPSFFCQSPKPWIQAMAFMARHQVIFRLFLCEYEGEREVSRTRVFPELDDEMRSLLASLNSDATDRIVEYGSVVNHILERLKMEQVSYDE